MAKGKKILLSGFMIGAIVLMGYLILNHQEHISVPAWPMRNLHLLQQYHSQYPVRSVLIFWLMHLLSSALSVPGSCTMLNIASGAVFGFGKGCLIVYSITLISACVGYFLGRILPLQSIKAKYSKQFTFIQKNFTDFDYLSMIMIRLSPFLPFGILNLVFGFLKVPFFTYIMSTTVGIFFDVVLLNSIGALLSGQQANGWQSKENMLLIFLSLFISTYILKIFKSKRILMSNQIKQED